MNPPEDDILLTPGEAAREFRVEPRTITKWANAGKITAIKTPGGTRRYRASEVAALKAASDSRQATP